MNHTPTPWISIGAVPVGYENPNIYIETKDVEYHATDVDLEFIVRACNNYADMVRAAGMALEAARRDYAQDGNIGTATRLNWLEELIGRVE